MSKVLEWGRAILVRPIRGWTGGASLYRLSPPYEHYDHVIVSSTFATTGPEVYIFAATAKGDVLGWSELPGSFQGGLDHAKALHGLGYEIVTD